MYSSRHTKFLQLQSKARVTLVDQTLEIVHRLGTMGRDQLLTGQLGSLHLGLVIAVRILDLAMEILLVLGGRFVALQPELPRLLVASLDAIVLLSQRVVLSLRLLHLALSILDLLLRVQPGLLPLLATPFDVRRQLLQVLRHLLERDGELQAVVGHAILYPTDLIVGTAVGSLAVIGPVRRLLRQAGEFLQTLRVFLLEGCSFLQEGCKVLSINQPQMLVINKVEGDRPVPRRCSALTWPAAL